MISIERNEQFYFFLTCLLSFLIPCFPLAVPFASLLIVINWILVPRNIATGINIVRNNYALLSMVLFFFIYLLGMLYTSNLTEGFSVLETKLSFLLFPFVFASYGEKMKKNINYYLKFFVFGCVAYAAICFSWAAYCFFKPVYTDLYGKLYDLGTNYFYYTYLSVFFHPSYTAMFSLFALICIFYLWKENALKYKWIWIMFMFFLIVFILLLSSKAGWIGLLILTVLFPFLYFAKPNYKAILLTFLGMSLLLVLFLFFNVYKTPDFSHRIPKTENITNAITETDENNNKVTTSTEGTGSRIFVWKASLEIIGENFLLGVGTGDAKEKMLKKYEQKEMMTEYKFQLNSHDQYLNTFIAVGILGGLSLLLCLILPFYYSYEGKSFLFMTFIFVVGMNLLFESMFERQAGVIFYTFFNTIFCLIFCDKKKRLIS
jgi:O-antigen ligase